MIAEGLVLDGVGLWLGDRRLIGPVDLALAPGDAAVLMGPSGSGKSSLLAFLCGTLDPAFRAEGRIRLAGQEIGALPPERRRLGILFQDDLLFPHLSVGGNLAFGLPAGLSNRERRSRASAALQVERRIVRDRVQPRPEAVDGRARRERPVRLE